VTALSGREPAVVILSEAFFAESKDLSWCGRGTRTNRTSAPRIHTDFHGFERRPYFSRNERARNGAPRFPFDHSLRALVTDRLDEFVNHVPIGELLVGMLAVERLVKANLL